MSFDRIPYALFVIIWVITFTPSYLCAQRTPILIDDFESGDYAGWHVDGAAFGTAPAKGALSGQQEVTGYSGQYLVNSFMNGDSSVGTLTSDAFCIARNYITFLLGGGANDGCRIELVADDRVIYATTPDYSEEKLKWNCWDVSHWQGEIVRIRIVDEATGGWGHICVDSIYQSDIEVIGNFEHTYAPWTIVEGNAFGTHPATSTLEGQNEVRGWNGYGYINTFLGGDAAVGVLRSPVFEITDSYICFRIGGGMDPSRLHAALYVAGERVLSATAADYIGRANDSEQEKLRPRSWDVSQWIGDSAYIEIVDASADGWGHICVDDFVFSSRPSSSVVDNRQLVMQADDYLQIPTQNWGPYVNVSIYDKAGNKYLSQRLRIARDAVDRYIPLYTKGLTGEQMYVSVGIDYEDGMFADKIHTSSESGLTPWEDPYRPGYHNAPAFGWMNDPNGLIYHNGVYHLFYQHYPYDPHWNDVHWGHATSKDLVHWEQQPIALFPDSYGLMFSGSIVVDEHNSAGFGAGAFVAVYTTTHPSQAQSLAYSHDDGMTWHKYGAPVLYGQGDFRDPKVFWYEPRGCWMMILANGFQVEVYSSSNLKQWNRELGWGGHVGAHGGVWECPDLVQVPIEGTNESRWVMIVSVSNGAVAGGSGTQYFIGDFRGNDFILHTDGQPLWMDYGKDNYAGITWSNIRDRRNRPIFVGWMNNWDYCNATPYEWSSFRGQNTFPRALSLIQTPEGLRLKSEPVEQLSLLRSDKTFEPMINLVSSPWQSDTIAAMKEGCYMIEMELSASKTSWKMTLKNDHNEFVAFGFNATTNEVYLDRKNSGKINFGKDFGVANQVARLSGDEFASRATVLVDKSSIELFINDGRLVLTDLIFPSAPYNQIELNPEGEQVEVKSLQVTAIEIDHLPSTDILHPQTTSQEEAKLRIVDGHIRIIMPDGQEYSIIGNRIK